MSSSPAVRQVVRQTWGRETPSQHGVTLRRVFLLGVPRNQSTLPLWDRLLLYESHTYKDILLWDFEDTFFNLTLKETHFLQWVNSSCPDVRSVLDEAVCGGGGQTQFSLFIKL